MNGAYATPKVQFADPILRADAGSVRFTGRPVTISEGTNLRVGTDPAKIVAAARNALAGKGKNWPPPTSVRRRRSQTDGRDSLEVGATGKCIVGVSNNSSTAVPKGLAPLASFHYASGQ